MSTHHSDQTEGQQEIPLPEYLIPLDFSSTTTIPESHIWPQPDVGDSSSPITKDEQVILPVVSLTDSNACDLIGKACESWGMFRLIDHGVPETLLAAAENEACELFKLPRSNKLSTLRTATDIAGYSMPGTSKFHPKYMWHEGFTMMGSPDPRHANLLWPTGHAEQFCEIMDEYRIKMTKLAQKIISLIFEYLGMADKETLDLLISDDVDGGIQKLLTAIRLIHYPPCPEPERVTGLAPHTDTALFTIVHQSRTEGLQIFKEGAGWVSVAPMTGSLVVNIGDLMQILSNERFRSITHRVQIQSRVEQRISVAFFFDPPYDLYVSPYCKPLSKTPQSAKYRSVTVKEYFTMKGNNNGFGIPLIRI